MNVAALDCGSNSTRLLVLSSSGEQLVRETVITRLSAGVDASGRLLESSIERTLETLAHYQRVMASYDVARSQLVATSAVRDATNREDFLQRAARVSGAPAEVIDGTTEARLSYLGATYELPSDPHFLVVDVGGGSTEICARVDGVVVGYSMQLGCVRVSERVLGSGVVTPSAQRAAGAMIDAEIDRALASQPVLLSLIDRARFVGLAGSVSTLVSLEEGLEVYDRSRIHHRVVALDRVKFWRDTLALETPEQRLARPGMTSGREDVLVAGLFVLLAVMERFGSTELLSSESDILDGVARSLLDDQDAD